MQKPSDPRFVDITGARYGRLTVLGYDGAHMRHHYWDCLCDCGERCVVESGNLKGGRIVSCGCARRESSRAIMQANKAAFTGSRRTHGMTNTPTFRSWNMMLQRCTNPKRSNYEYYGGRGISVCARWRSFANFLADMGERPNGMTLDRKDSNKNYTPSNCRWATKVQQSGNRRKRGPNKNPYSRE